MKYFRLFGVFTFLFCEKVQAQNLVPNPGFEQYYVCPTITSQIDALHYWFNPSIPMTGGSPDYYNGCSPVYDFAVPDNWCGYQPSHSGTGYVGIYMYHFLGTDLREFIEVELTSTLKYNTCYHVEMYVNVADACRYTTHSIGAYFSDTMISGVSNYLPLPVVPQISNSASNLFDSIAWLKVEGDFIAEGGERFLIIGNFNNDSVSNIQLVDSTRLYNFVYCFIEDVSVVECSLTGITEILSSYDEVHMIYNDFSSEITLETINDNYYEVILYDLLAHKVRKKRFHHSALINISDLGKGIYLYSIQNEEGVLKTGKICKRN